MASRTTAVALIVIDVDTRSSEMPPNSSVMSSIESTATPTRPDFARGQRIIRVVSHLCREVECHAQTADALIEQESVAPIGLGDCAETGVLTHGPQATPVHGGVDAASEGKYAREAERLRWVAGRSGRPE